MSNDHYPAGVTDAHPHFNPPREVVLELECGADAALVIPSFAIKADLNDLRGFVEGLRKHAERGDMPWAAESLAAITNKIDQSFNRLEVLEAEAEYECPFKGEVEVVESECAEWDCPVCGNERVSDTLPEERDPDEEWDSRYDD